MRKSLLNNSCFVSLNSYKIIESLQYDKVYSIKWIYLLPGKQI